METKDNYTSNQLAFFDDQMYLPIQYKGILAKQPYFEGKGNHSVTKLEEICEQYKEYAHQQAVIKNNLMKIVVDLRAKQAIEKATK